MLNGAVLSKHTGHTSRLSGKRFLSWLQNVSLSFQCTAGTLGSSEKGVLAGPGLMQKYKKVSVSLRICLQDNTDATQWNNLMRSVFCFQELTKEQQFSSIFWEGKVRGKCFVPYHLYLIKHLLLNALICCFIMWGSQTLLLTAFYNIFWGICQYQC